MNQYLPYITQQEIDELTMQNFSYQSIQNLNNMPIYQTPSIYQRPLSPSVNQRPQSPNDHVKTIIKKYNIQKGIENIYIWIGVNIETEQDIKNLIQTIVSGKPYVYMFCVSYYCENQEYIAILQNVLANTKFILTKSKISLNLDQHMNKLWECFSIHSVLRSIKKWDIIVFCEPKDIILSYINDYKNNRTFIAQMGTCLIRKEYNNFEPDVIINMITQAETTIDTDIEFYTNKCFSGTSLRIHFLDNYFKLFKEFKIGLFLKHIKLSQSDSIDPFIFHYTV